MAVGQKPITIKLKKNEFTFHYLVFTKKNLVITKKDIVKIMLMNIKMTMIFSFIEEVKL